MPTLRSKISALRDFIMKYNTYFDSGYDNVQQDQNTGYIANETEIVFPADNKGNLFYIRHPYGLGFDYTNAYRASDERSNPGVKYDMVLVAMVDGADEGLLLENMLTTLGNYNIENIKLIKALFGVDVITSELSKIAKEDIQKAIQNIPENAAFCAVYFTFTTPFIFQSVNCIQSPCVCQ